MKECKRCFKEKPQANFSKCKTAKDGLHSWCKFCVSIYKHENQHTRIEYNSKYYRTNKYREKSVIRQTNRRKSGCLKVKARDLLQSAVQRGKITKPTICSQCSTEFPIKEIHGHHIDYSLPYLVIWSCSKCHSKLELVMCNYLPR